ncbi:SPFH domain-containing protein [Nocardia sp. NPDC004722]
MSMAWFEREFIAVPEEAKNQLVFKWPDVNIRRFSRAMVNADETALFLKSGRVLAVLGPGRHRIDADELPVLGSVVDTLTGGNYYRAELYFVSSREFTGFRFGGRLTEILDPVSEQVVSLRAFGEFAVAARDPAALITMLTGTGALADRDATSSWCGELLLKAMKIAVTQGVSRGEWPVLGMSAELPAIEAAVLHQTNVALYEYGLRIPRLGNFDIGLVPEDADRLKRLAKDTTYIRLTGDFQRYAAGELALGAGQGLARGMPDTTYPVAVGGTSLWQQHPYPSPWTVLSAPTGTNCPRCLVTNAEDAQYCTECGAQMRTPAPRACAVCAKELSESARFCGHCGTAAAR